MSRRRRLIAFTLSAPLLLAACGNDDANPESLVTSLMETAELTEEDATCVSDIVFADEGVLALEQDKLNEAAADPSSNADFQAVVDTALATCIGL